MAAAKWEVHALTSIKDGDGWGIINARYLGDVELAEAEDQHILDRLKEAGHLKKFTGDYILVERNTQCITLSDKTSGQPFLVAQLWSEE